jgi:hypothetical protein
MRLHHGCVLRYFLIIGTGIFFANSGEFLRDSRATWMTNRKSHAEVICGTHSAEGFVHKQDI